jgi:hypothetical protein
MTKREVILQACRELGDTRTDFVDNVATPTLDFIFLDLAHHDAIAALRRTRTFTIEQDRRIYDTRELSQLAPHYPSEIVRLTIYPWQAWWCGWQRGGGLYRASRNEIIASRLLGGDEQRGRWQAWSVDLNPLELIVWPPAGATDVVFTDANGDEQDVECEVEFEALPADVPLDDDLVEIDKRAMNVLVYGLKWRLAAYKREWAPAVAENLSLYREGRSWMWGERKNRGVQDIELRY